jgi:hypothetical protein
MSRLLAATLVIAAIPSFASGCGSNSSHSSGNSESAYTARALTRSSAGRSVSKTQATAYAHAINLRTADLPRMAIGEHEGRDTPSGSSGTVPCAGLLNHSSPVVDVHSAQFKGGKELQREQVFLTISSDVAVMHTPALADRAVAVAGSTRGRACLLRYWQKLFSGKITERLRYGQVTIGSLPVAAPGTYGAYGLQVALRATVRGTSIEVPRYIDDFEFAYGHADVRLSVISSPHPFPQATEQLLLSVLVGRAERYSH